MYPIETAQGRRQLRVQTVPEASGNPLLEKDCIAVQKCLQLLPVPHTPDFINLFHADQMSFEVTGCCAIKHKVICTCFLIYNYMVTTLQTACFQFSRSGLGYS